MIVIPGQIHIILVIERYRGFLNPRNSTGTFLNFYDVINILISDWMGGILIIIPRKIHIIAIIERYWGVFEPMKFNWNIFKFL